MGDLTTNEWRKAVWRFLLDGNKPNISFKYLYYHELVIRIYLKMSSNKHSTFSIDCILDCNKTYLSNYSACCLFNMNATRISTSNITCEI